jgi:NADPH2:quinone reductase
VLSGEIAAKIAHLKADIVIDSSKDDVESVLISEKEAGHPVNVAMDCLGGELLGKCLPHMAGNGRWILISTLAGVTTEINLRPLLTGGVRLVGSMLRNRSPEMKARILKELVEKVWPKIESGEIRPSIYGILPIEQAQEAHSMLQKGENQGKVVLKVG